MALGSYGGRQYNYCLSGDPCLFLFLLGPLAFGIFIAHFDKVQAVEDLGELWVRQMPLSA